LSVGINDKQKKSTMRRRRERSFSLSRRARIRTKEETGKKNIVSRNYVSGGGGGGGDPRTIEKKRSLMAGVPQ